jgi:hydrogenase maturation protein HypF
VTAPLAARRILRVRGVVQGVGFRPFVYRVASELGLRGAVWNDAAGVVIDAEGDPAALAELGRRLVDAPPEQARVEAVDVAEAPPAGLSRFAIRDSAAEGMADLRVSADLATCAACRAELFDPADRRFRYPFIMWDQVHVALGEEDVL